MLLKLDASIEIASVLRWHLMDSIFSIKTHDGGLMVALKSVPPELATSSYDRCSMSRVTLLHTTSLTIAPL